MLLNFSGQQLTTLCEARINDTLISLGLDFEDITELDVSYCGLLSLQGLERFVNLQKLDACNNQIDAIAPIWGLTRLQVVKLRRNNINVIWLRRAGSATVIAATQDSDVPIGDVETARYTVLDLESNQIACIGAEPATYIETECLLLANNRINDFSGLKAFRGMRTLDISGNLKVDASILMHVPFNTKPRIFLQGCEVTQQECLLQILEHDHEAEIIASGDIIIDHPRVIKTEVLDLKQLCEKEFVDFGCEFADFRYKGDILPRELKTPRGYNDVKMETSHFVVRSKCPTKLLQTVSTVVDLADAAINMGRTLDNLRSCSTMGNESDTVTPMSINTMDGEMIHEDQTPTSRSLMSDYPVKEGTTLKGSYMSDITFTKPKLVTPEWQGAVNQEFYAQF